MAKESEIEITYKENKVKVTVKALTFGENNWIQEQCIKVDFVGSMAKPSINPFKMKELVIQKGLKVAPFEINQANIQALSLEDGEKLADAIQKLSGLSEEKKTISDTSSKE